MPMNAAHDAPGKETKPGKASSPILASVHETALDLYEAALIDPKTMREFDALCRPDKNTPAD